MRYGGTQLDTCASHLIVCLQWSKMFKSLNRCLSRWFIDLLENALLKWIWNFQSFRSINILTLEVTLCVWVGGGEIIIKIHYPEIVKILFKWTKRFCDRTLQDKAFEDGWFESRQTLGVHSIMPNLRSKMLQLSCDYKIPLPLWTYCMTYCRKEKTTSWASFPIHANKFLQSLSLRHLFFIHSIWSSQPMLCPLGHQPLMNRSGFIGNCLTEWSS